MAYTLNRIRQICLRSLYESIRVILVKEGYIPDILEYTTTPEYNTKLSQIKEEKGFSIDLFGHGSPISRGKLEAPRIVIRRRKTVPGDQGTNMGYSGHKREPDGTFRRVRYGGVTEDMYVDVYLISLNADQDELLHSFMSAAVGVFKYIPLVETTEPPKDPKNFMFIEVVNQQDYDDFVEGLLKYVYTYRVKDLHTAAVEYLEDIIVPTVEVSVEIISPEGDTLDSFKEVETP